MCSTSTWSEAGIIDYVMTDNSDAIGYLSKRLMDYNYESEDGAAILYGSKFLA